MKRTDLKKILIIGSGPIVIGQGCEFDYSGCQAVKALRREGYEIVLVNSNPATVTTDPEMAEATYIEPLTPDSVAAIIRKERPDALLPTLGGQTALNIATELAKSGVLAECGVEMIGADAAAIARAEDRNLFKAAMAELGLDIPKSGSAHSLDEADAIAAEIGSWPLIIRPGFTLGGTGGGIAHDAKEFQEIVASGLEASLNHEVLIEESLIGWKEFEMEVMRDKAGNAVIVCSIENMDPMGVHTGDSITVAPIQTLTDREYQAMRGDSIRVLEKIGIETGGSNVQWAVNPKTGRHIIIEMNPRVSRTVPFVSKAVGWSLAGAAARCMAGERLANVANVASVTSSNTQYQSTCAKATADRLEIGNNGIGNIFTLATFYCVKEAVFPFVKFPGADITLTPEMKSTGEVMAFGSDAALAYYKSQIAAGSPLPRPGHGGIVLSVRDEDKAEVVNLAKTLDSLGYEIWATRGTSTALWKAGIQSNALYKIALGSPNALDLIHLGKVKWIVNTREGGESAAHDSLKIRSAAVAAGIPVTTTLAGFAEAVRGIASIAASSHSPPLSLQEWHSRVCKAL